MQFHPEKSQDVGLRLVAAFVRLVDEAKRADPRERSTEGAARPREMTGHTEGA